MEQPHIRAHPSKRAALRNTRCWVRRTEKAGQRQTIPSSTSAQHTPNPEGSKRMLCSLATKGPAKTTLVHSRTPSAQRPTTDCDCAIALSRAPEQLAGTAAIAQTVERLSTGRLDQHTTPSTIGQKTGPRRTKPKPPRTTVAPSTTSVRHSTATLRRQLRSSAFGAVNTLGQTTKMTQDAVKTN